MSANPDGWTVEEFWHESARSAKEVAEASSIDQYLRKAGADDDHATSHHVVAYIEQADPGLVLDMDDGSD